MNYVKIVKKVLLVIIGILALVGLASVITFVGIQLHLTNVPGISDTTNRYLQASTKNAWKESAEWQTLKKAMQADASTLNKAAEAADVKPRLIAAQLVVEQLRLYTSEREIFKEIFSPLKILGVQSQFSWGVMGLKQDTAIQIEQNLSSTTSPFYLGKNFENILAFKTADLDTERFDRIVNEKDHYYSYLYSALYLKEIINQWKKAGYDISSRSEILSTLYNIGFVHSIPNNDPKVGGAEITIENETYSFGELAYAFYTSDELVNEFPR